MNNRDYHGIDRWIKIWYIISQSLNNWDYHVIEKLEETVKVQDYSDIQVEHQIDIVASFIEMEDKHVYTCSLSVAMSSAAFPTPLTASKAAPELRSKLTIST